MQIRHLLEKHSHFTQLSLTLALHRYMKRSQKRILFYKTNSPVVFRHQRNKHSYELIGPVLSTFCKLAWLMRTFPLVYLCLCQRHTSWLHCYAWLRGLNIFLLPADYASPKPDKLLYQNQLWHHDTFLFSIYVT